MGSLNIKYSLVLAMFCAVSLWGCQPVESKQSTAQQTKKIIIYGLNTCDHCIKFKAQMDSLGFVYDFRDMENNDALTNELITKIQAAGIVGQINYPVVDIEGKILVSPELNQVLPLMK